MSLVKDDASEKFKTNPGNG